MERNHLIAEFQVVFRSAYEPALTIFAQTHTKYEVLGNPNSTIKIEIAAVFNRVLEKWNNKMVQDVEKYKKVGAEAAIRAINQVKNHVKKEFLAHLQHELSNEKKRRELQRDDKAIMDVVTKKWAEQAANIVDNSV